MQGRRLTKRTGKEWGEGGMEGSRWPLETTMESAEADALGGRREKGKEA